MQKEIRCNIICSIYRQNTVETRLRYIKIARAICSVYRSNDATAIMLLTDELYAVTRSWHNDERK